MSKSNSSTITVKDGTTKDGTTKSPSEICGHAIQQVAEGRNITTQSTSTALPPLQSRVRQHVNKDPSLLLLSFIQASSVRIDERLLMDPSHTSMF